MYSRHHSPEWDDDVQNNDNFPHELNRDSRSNPQLQHHQASSSRSDPSYNIREAQPIMTPRVPGSYNMASLPYQYLNNDHHHAIITGTEEQTMRQTPFIRTGLDQGHFTTSAPGFLTPLTPSSDDEPTDILVWNTTQGNHRHSSRLSHNNQHRSNSDTEDGRLGHHRSASNRTIASKSRSVRSLGVRESNGNLTSEDYESHLVSVTKQLEQIKTTQDSILSELTDDISNLQFENVQLKNTNEHLTMQNSHLLQVISDLSNEVEHMREVFRIRGWSVKQLGEAKVPSASAVEATNNDDSWLQSKQHQEKGNNCIREMMTPSLKDPVQTNNPSEMSVPGAKKKHRTHHKNKEVGNPTKFETVSLVDTQKQKGVRNCKSRDSSNCISTDNNKHLAGPGDDQVAALANTRSSHSPRTRRKSKLSKSSVDSVSTSRQSLQHHKSKNNHGKNHDDNNEDKKSDGNCLKNLFKRYKNKQRSSHRTPSNVIQ